MKTKVELTSESASKAEENFANAIKRAPVRNNILKHLSIVPTEAQADKFEDKKLKSLAVRCAKLKTEVKTRLGMHKADVKLYKDVKTIKALAELRTLKVSELDRIGVLLNGERLGRMEQDYTKKMATRWRPVLSQVDVIRKQANTYNEASPSDVVPKSQMVKKIPTRVVNNLSPRLKKYATEFNKEGEVEVARTSVTEFINLLVDTKVAFDDMDIPNGKVRFMKIDPKKSVAPIKPKTPPAPPIEKNAQINPATGRPYRQGFHDGELTNIPADAIREASVGVRKYMKAFNKKGLIRVPEDSFMEVQNALKNEGVKFTYENEFEGGKLISVYAKGEATPKEIKRKRGVKAQVAASPKQLENFPVYSLNSMGAKKQRLAMMFNEKGRADVPKTLVVEFEGNLNTANIAFETQELSAGKVRFMKPESVKRTEAVGVKRSNNSAVVGRAGTKTGTDFGMVLVQQVKRSKSAPLTAVPVAALPKFIEKQLPKKGWEVLQADFSTYDEGKLALAGLKRGELAVSAGAPDVVEKALSRFQFVADSSADFIIAAAMDVSVNFRKKGERAQGTDAITGFQSAKHVGAFTYAEDKVRAFKLPTIDGSIIVYMPAPSKEEQLTHAFREKVRKYKFRKAGTRDVVVVPNVNMEHTTDVNSTVDLKIIPKNKSGDVVAASNVLTNTSFDLITKFEMDEVGARIRQVAAVNMTKSLPRRFKIDRPFVVIVERGGREIFSGYIAKDSWIKG